MNEEQRQLYDEWHRVEEATRIEVYISRIGAGNQPPIKAIDFAAWERARVVRQRVWDELFEFLSVDERFDLGKRLDKSLPEIFAPEIEKWKTA